MKGGRARRTKVRRSALRKEVFSESIVEEVLSRVISIGEEDLFCVLLVLNAGVEMLVLGELHSGPNTREVRKCCGM